MTFRRRVLGVVSAAALTLLTVGVGQSHAALSNPIAELTSVGAEQVQGAPSANGFINADQAAIASGVPANYQGGSQPPVKGPSPQRSTTNLSFCFGTGGTYTHCEGVACTYAYPYKNYNPSTDKFTDPIQDFYGTGFAVYYDHGDAVEVRDGAARRSGPRGVLIYTGTAYDWAWSSVACFGA